MTSDTKINARSNQSAGNTATEKRPRTDKGYRRNTTKALSPDEITGSVYSQPYVTEWVWDPVSETAALEVAQNKLSDERIATNAGVDRVTLWRWKHQPEFAARVQAHRDHWAKELKDLGLADKRNRITTANDDFLRTSMIIAERAADPAMQHVPGGRSGYLVRQQKTVGTGKNAETVEEYVFDAALFKARESARMYVAKELGQWVERQESKQKVSIEEVIAIVSAEYSDVPNMRELLTAQIPVLTKMMKSLPPG